MAYNKCWDEKDVDLCFTTESRDKNREVFEKTHLPIRKIRVDFSKDLPTEKDFITEEELKELVISSSPDDHNRIFLIVGETGCGKSELCQWLEYNIHDGLHIPVHISRSDTRMEDIARILNSHLPVELRESIQSGELTNIRPGHVADFLVAKLRIELDRDKTISNPRDRQILEKLFNDDIFRRKLAMDVEDYQKSISTKGKERRLLILSRKNFEFFPSVRGLSNINQCYRFINNVITTTLKEYLKVSDVGGRLRQISEHYCKLGRRPVLLLEDLTSFSFLAEDLIDYLFDLPKGHFDVVIGWTTGFETGYRDYIFKAPDALTYMKERIRARLLLTDEKGSTFFMKDSYRDLVRKYLSAVKCGKCKICKTDTEGLYPFNSACIDRIYENLQEEGNPKQTPRIFLEFVIRRVLQSWSEYPWKTLSTIPYLKHAPLLIGQVYPEFPEFVELVRWYGKDNERDVELAISTAEWFKIQIPITATAEKYVIPKSRVALLVNRPTVETEYEKPPVSESDLIGFEQWVTAGGKFLDRDSLRKGAIAVLQLITDPSEIRNPKSTLPKTVTLFYQRGSDPLPVFIEDSGDDISDIDYKAHVSRKSPASVLEQLYCMGKGMTLPETTLVETLEWASEQDLKYNEKLKANLSDALGIAIEEFVLFSKFLLANLSSGCRALDSSELRKDLEQNESVSEFFDENLRMKTLAFLQISSSLQGLFSSFFFVTSTFFDHLHFSEVCEKIDIPKTLNAISRIDCRTIRDAYKVGTKKENIAFREFARVVRDYASALRQFPYTEYFSSRKSELTTIQGLIPLEESLEKIHESISKIKAACGTLEIPLEESWIQSFNSISSQEYDFGELHNEITAILSDFSQCQDVFHYIEFAHRFEERSRRPEYNLISTLGQIILLVNSKLDNTIEQLKNTAPSLNTERLKEIYERLSKLTSEFA